MDADTPDDSLVYTVLRTENDAGHVERTSVPSKAITSFTQTELIQGSIAYVHHGKGDIKNVDYFRSQLIINILIFTAKTNSNLLLQVSDGMESSQQASLRVSAFDLKVSVEANTGLIVVHRSYSYLTAANLSFTSNADEKNIEIQLEIVDPPQYGVIQRLKDSGVWEDVRYFSNRDVELHAVRYLHNLGSPSHDHFKFNVSVRDVRMPSTYDFRVTFIDLELRESRRGWINFTDTSQVVVNSHSLMYQTNPLATSPNKITYAIVRAPSFGHVLLDNQIVHAGNTFTQDKLDAGRVTYRLFRRAYSTIVDEFAFKVTAPQCMEIQSHLPFKHYLRDNSRSVEKTVELVRVDEGARSPLRVVQSHIKDFGVSSLMYNLTVLPRHGWLAVMNLSNAIVRGNASYFTSNELTHQLVYYVHDDSETRSDEMQFLAVSTDQTDFMYVGKFKVDVNMKNDNPPRIKHQRAFQVVLGGERLITSNDLLYQDSDIDTEPSDLVYVKQSIDNGRICLSVDPSVELHKFSQQDVNDHKILLKHHGKKHGKFEFNVTDGHFVALGYLNIHASKPYVKLPDINSSIVQFNRSVVLTVSEVDVDTNVYAKNSEIEYHVLEAPKHGVLLKHHLQTADFTHEELIGGAVSYKHRGSSLNTDNFKVRVSTRNAEDTGSFSFGVYPDSYWEPLAVVNNKTIFVEEATSVMINRKSLEISHPKIPPSQIVYVIRRVPQNGILELQNQNDHMDEARDEFHDGNYVKRFEQSLINDGRVHYVQSISNQSNDKFIVDVTNGITWMRDVHVNFIIVPNKLYVTAKQLSVEEGKSIALAGTDFTVYTSYYAGKITDYKVVEKPRHGLLMDSNKNSQINKFSQKHLDAGFILYRHNGDEALDDDFKLTIYAGDKSSEPVAVKVFIQPVNDQPPVLLNKTELLMLQGGSMVIESSLLAAVDNDTEPRYILFNVTNVRNGFISFVHHPRIHSSNFTQENIDNSMVLFTHTGQ